MDARVSLSVKDKVATILLDRPEAYNALDRETVGELQKILLQASTDPGIHGVVITGAGKAFSAGGDIRGVMAHPQGPAAAFNVLAAHVHVCVVEIRRMRKPVVAAINGVAAGGGFSLALASDFRVMARSARLKQGFTSNALCIDGGATFTLPRLVGLARALEIAAFDEPIGAEQALAWGLVTKVVDDGTVVAEAERMVRAVAEKSLHTFGWSKQLLTNSSDTPLEAHLECERQGLIACVSHPDGVEGMTAFLEKRPPMFNR
jgi:2-(1,2-epoxy-1,2-dihydrophenyl)acetyl-CoA isomerase